MFDDDINFFDIFRELFRDDREYRSKFIDYNLSERVIDDNNVYYTLVTNLDVMNNIIIRVSDTEVQIKISDLTYDDIIRLKSPVYLIPNKFKSTYVNGILDITTYIDKERDNEEEDKYFT